MPWGAMQGSSRVQAAVRGDCGQEPLLWQGTIETQGKQAWE